MTFETTAAGNKNGSTRPKGTNCLSLHDRTSLPVFFVGQYTGKCGRLQYGIFNKNRRAAGGGLHVSAMTNKNADAGLGVLRAKWRRTFQPRFRMRRRRGGVCKAASAVPQAHSFLSCQKLQCSAPFSLRGKEKAAGGKKKTAKGELRRNKLHIPHPVRRLRRTGVVRSVVPPFPTRIAALDSRGSPVPFANPLKRPGRGLRPPSLDFPRSLIRTEIIFGFTKRGTDAYLPDRRGRRNTLRLFRMPFAWKIVTRDTQSSPCRKNGLSTFIRQIFNGRKQNDLHSVSCAWKTRFYGRPKGVPCGTYHR